MNFTFTRNYLCCCCDKKVWAKNAARIYDKYCICDKCDSKLDRVSDRSTFAGTRNISFVSSVFFYNDVYRNMFLKYKFYNHKAAGHLIGMEIEEYFKRFEQLSSYDFLVPVPLQKSRFIQRGYNQVDIFAQYVSGALGIPINNCLHRCRDGKPQSSLSGVDRIENILNSFKASCDLTGKRIIIVDDVCTTGNTLEQCARAVKMAGASYVCAISAAHVYIKQKQLLL